MTWLAVRKKISGQAQQAVVQLVGNTLHAGSLASYLLVGWVLEWIRARVLAPPPWNWMFYAGEGSFFLVFVYRLIAELLFRRGRRRVRRGQADRP